MMYKSQFFKKYPYDWFCGPGSHIKNIIGGGGLVGGVGGGIFSLWLIVKISDQHL